MESIFNYDSADAQLRPAFPIPVLAFDRSDRIDRNDRFARFLCVPNSIIESLQSNLSAHPRVYENYYNAHTYTSDPRSSQAPQRAPSSPPVQSSKSLAPKRREIAAKLANQ